MVVGKTTTIGKLAGKLREQGKKVVLAAAETFRAAAADPDHRPVHLGGHAKLRLYAPYDLLRRRGSFDLPGVRQCGHVPGRYPRYRFDDAIFQLRRQFHRYHICHVGSGFRCSVVGQRHASQGRLDSHA